MAVSLTVKTTISFFLFIIIALLESFIQFCFIYCAQLFNLFNAHLQHQASIFLPHLSFWQRVSSIVKAPAASSQFPFEIFLPLTLVLPIAAIFQPLVAFVCFMTCLICYVLQIIETHEELQNSLLLNSASEPTTSSSRPSEQYADVIGLPSHPRSVDAFGFSVSLTIVADAAINDAVASVNDRALLNDVDDQVLLSILQSQKTSFYVAFFLCLLLLWFQSPLLNSLSHVFPFFPIFRVLLSLLASLPPASSQPQNIFTTVFAPGFINPTVFPLYLDDAAPFPLSLGACSIEIVHIILLLCWLIFSTLLVVHKFYKLGSDPLSVKSAQESKMTLESLAEVNAAPETSRDACANISYVSPSRTILDSIKYFNASLVRSGDADPAARHS